MLSDTFTKSLGYARTPRWRVLGAAAALLLATFPAWSIEAFTADYLASYKGMQATGKMTLAAESGDRWRYTLAISTPLANLNQSTVFEDSNGTWRPLSSEDSTQVLVKRSSKTATYDWGQGVATWSGDVKPERSKPIKLQAGDMDALLINLALVRDLAAGKPLKYRMVDDGRVKQLSYKVSGKESISVDGNQVEATKVVNTDGDKQTIAWLVEGMPIPARILQRKGGKDDIDLRVKSVN
ncbi:DUF3108 domain-containing protein [Lysobacter sp. A03]|uniref:DUF3108 domain-containing protein n=1 Tax=Lysobacter sp. A03 TaxID=1199154 RepID=UPI0005C6583A|nr:DUF3108 domain-containing protein [Lysobacter sp. A03]